jgi:hypothetical protein
LIDARPCFPRQPKRSFALGESSCCNTAKVIARAASARLFVRNSNDTPHTAHLIFVCALVLVALVAGGGILSQLLLIAAACWMLIRAANAFGNFLAAGVPFRCHDCGSAIPPAAVLADLTEQQRLQAALAKAAKRGG